VEDPPGSVVSHVIYDDGGAGRVGHVHKNVVTALLLLLLLLMLLEFIDIADSSSSRNNLVVDNKVRQQRVGSQHLPWIIIDAIYIYIYVYILLFLPAHNRCESVRFYVFTTVTMKNGVFWDVTPCGSCKNRRFGGT
jgi:hypothetical protein